jgi:exonuclease VII small subunit
LKDLEEFEKITKQLQNSDTNLSDVRAIFDAAIEQYP